jgi:hypothetical protein
MNTLQFTPSIMARIVGVKKKSVLKGITVCWGADPRWASLPVSLPKGARLIKRRVRADSVAYAYIRNESGALEKWILQPVASSRTNPITNADSLRLVCQQGINARN